MEPTDTLKAPEPCPRPLRILSCCAVLALAALVMASGTSGDSIEGVLVSADGSPIQGEVVYAVPEDVRAPTRSWSVLRSLRFFRNPQARAEGKARTDAEGKFRIEGLPVGSYVLDSFCHGPDARRWGKAVPTSSRDVRLVASKVLVEVDRPEGTGIAPFLPCIEYYEAVVHGGRTIVNAVAFGGLWSSTGAAVGATSTDCQWLSSGEYLLIARSRYADSYFGLRSTWEARLSVPATEQPSCGAFLRSPDQDADTGILVLDPELPDGRKIALLSPVSGLVVRRVAEPTMRVNGRHRTPVPAGEYIVRIHRESHSEYRKVTLHVGEDTVVPSEPMPSGSVELDWQLLGWSPADCGGMPCGGNILRAAYGAAVSIEYETAPGVAFPLELGTSKRSTSLLLPNEPMQSRPIQAGKHLLLVRLSDGRTKVLPVTVEPDAVSRVRL